jgi:hypothetical protein
MACGYARGGFYAEWDPEAPVTREGQLIFFFQFLHAGGRWEEFLRGCPLHSGDFAGPSSVSRAVHAASLP